MEKTTVVAIDVGTSKVCTLIAQTEGMNTIRIIGVGTEPTLGIRKGTVIDVPSASASIAKSVKKAERTAGVEVANAIVSLAGSHISSENNRATVSVVGGVVDQFDIDRVEDSVKAVPVPHNRVVINSIKRSYSIDGVDGIRTPLGMYGSRLDLEAHIITAAQSSVENLRKCVMDAQVDVDNFVLNALADGEAVLTEIEKNMGVAICNIGAGTADLALYISDDVWHTSVIPVGGAHITSDISQAFHLPVSQAEEVKLLHGSAAPKYVKDDEYFYSRTFGQDEAAKFSRKELSEIIQMRTEEIFQLIKQEIKRSGYDNLLPAGMVLTGGTALLPGIEQIASEVLEMPVRVARPEGITGMIDQLDSPEFTTAVGLVYWAMRYVDPPEEKKGNRKSEKQSAYKRFIQFFKDSGLLP